jgi:hypothetical protein
MLIDRDVIMRQLRFLQQLLARALKRQQEQDFGGALDELRGGYREALGLPYEMLARVDVDSALLLLATDAKKGAYLELLRAEAEATRGLGDAAAAEALLRRAAQVERRLAASPAKAKGV